MTARRQSRRDAASTTSPTSCTRGLGLDSVAELVVYAVDEEDVTTIDTVVASRARTVVGVAWMPHGARLQVGAPAVRYQ